MKCPRCKQEVPDGPECASCGIVVEKFLARQRREQYRDMTSPDRSGESPSLSSDVPIAASPDSPPGPDAPDADKGLIRGQLVAQNPPVGPAPTVRPAPVGKTGLGKVADRRLIGIYGQLARMLEAGLSVVEVLNLAARNTRGRISAALSSIRADVESGQTFAHAATGQPGLFPEQSQVLIEAGEQTGGLPAAMRALASAAELRLDLRRQIMRGFIYPFVLFTLVFFVPKAYLLFTVGLLAYLAACLIPYLTTLAVLFCLFWVLPWALKQALGPLVISNFVRRLPICRGLFALSAEVRFARHLAGAMEAGLAMPAAIRLAARSTGDGRYEHNLMTAERTLDEGGTLHQSLEKTDLFDGDFLLAVSAGERSGRLDEALNQHASLIQSTLVHRLNVTVQLASVAVLILTYVFVAQTVVSEFESVLGGAKDQMNQVLKELGGDPNTGLDTLFKEIGKPAGYSRLPQELKDVLK